MRNRNMDCFLLFNHVFVNFYFTSLDTFFKNIQLFFSKLKGTFLIRAESICIKTCLVKCTYGSTSVKP